MPFCIPLNCHLLMNFGNKRLIIFQIRNLLISLITNFKCFNSHYLQEKLLYPFIKDKSFIPEFRKFLELAIIVNVYITLY